MSDLFAMLGGPPKRASFSFEAEERKARRRALGDAILAKARNPEAGGEELMDALEDALAVLKNEER